MFFHLWTTCKLRESSSGIYQITMPRHRPSPYHVWPSIGQQANIWCSCSILHCFRRTRSSRSNASRRGIEGLRIHDDRRSSESRTLQLRSSLRPRKPRYHDQGIPGGYQRVLAGAYYSHSPVPFFHLIAIIMPLYESWHR